MPPKRFPTYHSDINGANGIYFSLTGWDRGNVVRNHNRLIDFGISERTALVAFRYRVRGPEGRQPGRTDWRSTRVLLNLPSDNMRQQDMMDWIDKVLKTMLVHEFDLVQDLQSGKAADENASALWLDDVTHDPEFHVDSIHRAMTSDDLTSAMGLIPDLNPQQNMRMYGYHDDHRTQHRAFRYMIEGCDIANLHPIVPDIHINGDEPEGGGPCDRMCAYKMLADLNTPGYHCSGTTTIFRPENVNKWLNDNGRAVGGLQDGLTPDDIQAHAVHFRYGHCALDLTRSVLNLYIPFNRHRHYKTACYVVVGDHCQPIVDRAVVMSIMKTASDRLGRRRIAMHHNHSSNNPTTNHATEIGIQQTLDRRKRRRSLDRVFRPEYEKSEERIQTDQWKESVQNNVDLTMEDWEDDALYLGSENSPIAQIPELSDSRKRVSYPLVSEVDRFHFFTKAEDLHIVEEKCKPTYREGEDPNKIHYYICTDEDDVEFIYHYLIRVLKIDPMRYARSYNGQCRQVRMQNTIWLANRHIHSIMELHGHLHPTEPFRPCGLGNYAFRLLQRELTLKTRRAGAIWECMSHYPPNLQRLLDTHHPFQRPKLIQRTFQPPYSNPHEQQRQQNQQNQPTVTTLIPMAQRRRIDLIRSYASTIRNFENDDMYPIHDPTNQVVPFREDLHGSIPVGHYLVELPTQQEIMMMVDNNNHGKNHAMCGGTPDDWKILGACLPPGQKRMMSHRMVRNLLSRNLIRKDQHIRLVCATDPSRQKKYGRTLVEALQAVLEKIYKTSQWSENVQAKHFVNHLIGLCNGTSIPHSGMRYVFHDLRHLYQLLVTVVSEDQLRRMRIFHVTGHDPVWHKSYDYYELDSSGMTYRSLHFQPIYNVVLEDQAIKIFDTARQIPLSHLININVDAIEYKIPILLNKNQKPQWMVYLENITVPFPEDGGNGEIHLTNAQIYDQFMGWFQAEHPKTEDKAAYYYYLYGLDRITINNPHSQQATSTAQLLHHIRSDVKQFVNQQGILRTSHNGAVIVYDPEDQDPVDSWKNSLRPVVPEDGQSSSTIQLTINAMFTTERENRSGLLVTGPAGTGKTYAIQTLHQYAVNIGLKVIKTAYTHAACVQMGADAVTLCSLFGVDEKADVRCMLATSRKFGAQLRALEVDVLIIDEISMIPLNLLEVLLVFHRVCSQTRICCFGDFHQLPPVEPGWDRGESFSFFDHTDIFPYLLYDRVRNVHGHWIQLRECMRTQDPLLVRICQDPASVTTIQPSDFPMPSLGIPIWRFICWRNTTRKACNWYCMHRYLQMFPDHTRVRLSLVDLYVDRKLRDQKARQNNNNKPSSSSSSASNSTSSTDEDNQTNHGRFDAEYFRVQFYNNSSGYKPGHWKYLQSHFTWAVGMEVVCRNTMKQWESSSNSTNNGTTNNASPSEDGPTNPNNNSTSTVVNNRRGVITEIDHDNRTITLIWLDVLKKKKEKEKEKEETGNDTIRSGGNNDTDPSSSYLTFTYYDFAFNFVPGFCITSHMAQGETIREHYCILEWSDIAPQPKMAYVAVTRGSTSTFLHLLPSPFADPWNTSQDTSNLRDNILRKMYHSFRWDREATFAVDIDDVIHQLENVQNHLCAQCAVPLVTTKYNPYKSPPQVFMFPQHSLRSPSSLAVVCEKCYSPTLASSSSGAVVHDNNLTLVMDK